jgi:hypothetical protein
MSLLKSLAQLLGIARKPCPPTRVLCVHGKSAFQRNIIAAQLFLEQLSIKETGAIICSSAAIVPILERLGFDVEDNIRWWTTQKKLEYAEHVLSESLPHIKLSLTPIAADVVWVDGIKSGYKRIGDEVIVFSGKSTEEPFADERRETHICMKSGTKTGRTLPGQSCMSWIV